MIDKLKAKFREEILADVRFSVKKTIIDQVDDNIDRLLDGAKVVYHAGEIGGATPEKWNGLDTHATLVLFNEPIAAEEVKASDDATLMKEAAAYADERFDRGDDEWMQVKSAYHRGATNMVCRMLSKEKPTEPVDQRVTVEEITELLDAADIKNCAERIRKWGIKS